MPQFIYSCLNAQGKTIRGQIEAASRQAAIGKLRKDGLTPFELSLVTANALDNSIPFWKREISFRKRVPKVAIAALARQLATLLKAGLPLDKALYAIYSGDSKSSISRVVASLRETIMGGKELAQGMTMYPAIFSSTFVAMTRAGEASGALDLVMERLAGHLEQEVAMRRKVRSALAYPVLMLIVGFAVVIFLLSFVIPQVTRIFAEMGRELPLPTRILINSSETFRSWYPLFILAALAMLLFFWRMLKTERGRRLLQSQIFNIPIAGQIYGLTLLSNFSRTLGMLLKNGVPLLKGLRIVQAASTNILALESVERMIEGVQEGRDLSAFMVNEKIYPPIARQMVAAGEKSGRLAEMLLWVAADAENQTEARLQSLASLLEPVMILVLGTLVGFVVIAIILPIFEMSSLAG